MPQTQFGKVRELAHGFGCGRSNAGWPEHALEAQEEEEGRG